MSVLPIPAFTDNYIWTIPNPILGVFDCIDPGAAEPIIHFAQTTQLELRAVLLTHHHHDHIGGVNQLVKLFPSCTVYGPNDPRITQINHPVTEHELITLAPYSFQILFNPGHTSSHISYYEPQQHWLFCGDTLFSAGCGRVFDGSLQELHQSMHLFKTLPKETKIFCAHEYTIQNLRFAQTVEPKNQFIQQHLYQLQQTKSCSLPTTLATELFINPFLRTDSLAVQDYANQHGATSTDSLEVFRVLREQKNLFI